ncbi:hypothetical protein ABZ776_36005, partial [Streptomyces sp. NPDC007076]|uniref:hypothetical protein n=1 Tax=Streptomyces sp. NPDC007076 TaxID=3160975 RepID=UPI0033CFED08
MICTIARRLSASDCIKRWCLRRTRTTIRRKPEAAAVVLGDVRERLEQVDRRHDDVVEVQRV